MDTNALVARLRRIGTDLSEVEVKSAAGGMPKSVTETVSAFANTSGGTVLLGLDEHTGFTPSDGFRAESIRDALVAACANGVAPPVRVPIEIEEFEGSLVVRADIPELDPVDQPCFVKARGEYQGSFIRSGDDDLLLTQYEVTQLLSNRTQPVYDTEPVMDASLSDLDQNLVAKLIRRVRNRSRRAFADLTNTDALVRLGAARIIGGQEHPTLAGLQCLGVYPQQFFPQLFVSFVVLPGLHMGQQRSGEARFLDNATLDGPIPHILSDATAVLLRNIRSAAVVTGLGREDRYDYPIEVFRELLVNALMHRDYSPHARGTQIQVELYPDRLMIKSPGGLYGSVRVQSLGTAEQISSSRNAVLARLLADVELPGDGDGVICENRGSGLPNAVLALRQAGMSPPAFDVTPGHTFVTVTQHALLSMDVIEWIGTLDQSGLSDLQHLALAIMRSAGRVTNGMLQAWGADRVAAGAALRDLVDRDLVSVSGGKRYTSYRLNEAYLQRQAVKPVQASSKAAGIEAELDAIKQAIQAGHTTARDLEKAIGLSYDTVHRRLRMLRERGEVEQTHARTDRRQSYRLTTQGD